MMKLCAWPGLVDVLLVRQILLIIAEHWFVGTSWSPFWQAQIAWTMMKLCVWPGLVDVLLVRRPRKAHCVQPLHGFPQCVSLLHTTNVKLRAFGNPTRISWNVARKPHTSVFWCREPDPQAFQTCDCLLPEKRYSFWKSPLLANILCQGFYGRLELRMCFNRTGFLGSRIGWGKPIMLRTLELACAKEMC